MSSRFFAPLAIAAATFSLTAFSASAHSDSPSSAQQLATTEADAQAAAIVFAIPTRDDWYLPSGLTLASVRVSPPTRDDWYLPSALNQTSVRVSPPAHDDWAATYGR
jgi:hypothetical protein